MTWGLAGSGRPAKRCQANRCPSCQETRVYQRRCDKYRVSTELIEIAHHPPQRAHQPAEPADLEN